jgi:glycerol-3-phosphate acyltransferase PlsY
MLADIALIVGAYLLGTFPYMLLLSKYKGIDITQERDYHLAMWQKVGRVEGGSALIVDIIKGVIPILVGFFLHFNIAIVAAAGVASVFGQMWPVFERFDGGKGNTTGAGAGLTFSICYLAPWVISSAAICFFIGFAIKTIPRFIAKGESMKEKLKLSGPESNSVPLGMLAGFIAMPLVSWLLNYPVEITLALLAILISIIIRRLTASIKEDINTGKTGIWNILWNRFLFDRGFY